MINISATESIILGDSMLHITSDSDLWPQIDGYYKFDNTILKISFSLHFSNTFSYLIFWP